MKKLISPLLILFIIVWASNVEAQNFARKGIIELGGTVGFDSDTDVRDGETADNSTTTFSFEPIFGYFIMDGLELALVPHYQSTSHGDNPTQSQFMIFFVPSYNFDVQSNVYPYIGGLIGYNSFDEGSGDANTGFSWGGMAGIKVQIGNATLINIGARYLLITANPDNWEGDRNGANRFEIIAGFSAFLGN